MTTEERLLKTKMWLGKSANFPFFSYLLFLLKTVEDETTPTAGIDGKNLYVNPAWINKLSDKELRFVLIHEVMHLCFPKDTLILGENKLIQDYKIGDRVITSSGKTEKVSQIIKTKYNNNLLEIKANGCLPFQCTPDHQILTYNVDWKTSPMINGIRGNNIRFIKNKQWKSANRLQVYSYKNKKTGKHQFHTMGDWLLIPKIKQCYDSNFILPIIFHKYKHKQIKNNSIPLKLTKSIKINKDIAWFLGLYTAEGYSCLNGSSGLCLGINEMDLAIKAQKILKKHFGLRVTIKKRKNNSLKYNNIMVLWHSITLGRLLHEYVGKGAKNKKIPDFVLYNKKHILQSFLRGYWQGDGCVVNGKRGLWLSCGTASKVLILQLQLSFARFGLLLNINKSTSRDKILNFKGIIKKGIIRGGILYRGAIKNSCAFTLLGYKENRNNKRETKFYFNSNKGILVPIRSIKSKDYNEYVYNLEVQNNPTYLVSNVVVHNCYGHLWRVGSKDKLLYNIASDFVINSELQSYNNLEMPRGCLLDPKYKDWFSEQVYADLLKNAKKIKINVGNSFDKDNKGNSCRGSHDKWGKESKSQQKKLERKWQRAVKQAAEIAKQKGNLPGYLQRLVDEQEPQISWQELLSNYLVKSSFDDYTYSRCDRRFLGSEFIMPSTEDDNQIEDVIVAIDTSGSITRENLSSFVSEVKSLLNSFNNIRGFMCSIDTEVYDFKEFDKYELNIPIMGGGGTDYSALWKEIEKRKIDPSVVLFFGDGYAEYGKEPNYPVIFLLTKDHQNPPFGRKIIYKN